MNGQDQPLSEGMSLAGRLCESYLRRPRRVDRMLEELPASVSPEVRRRCQFLFLGVIRNLSLIGWIVDRLTDRTPRRKLRALLYLAIGEILVGEEDAHPRIVDHAVRRAKPVLSPSEVSFFNAVLRKVAPLIEAKRVEIEGALGDGERERSIGLLALYYSHPEWLIRRWLLFHSWGNVHKLLRWNQAPPPVYLRMHCERGSNLPFGRGEQTPWRGFYSCRGAPWSEVLKVVKSGCGYVMDPGSRSAVELLDPKRGERVLDLCAAPGGKSRLIAERLSGSPGLLVSFDRSGPQVARLRENLVVVEALEVRVVEADLLCTGPATLRAEGLPGEYDAVLIDVPCSNTGVLRRRPDVRWRLKPGRIEEHAQRELELLVRASEFVRPGGRLVYSTCSIEPEENEQVVEAFMQWSGDGFSLIDFISSKPWISDHDGGGSFLLAKCSST